MSKQFEFIQYRDTMKIPDGIYNGLYNKEPSVIRMENSIPTWVTFIGFMKNDEPKGNSIFKAAGIMHSNVELLLPAQTLKS